MPLPPTPSPSPLDRPGIRWGLQFGLWTAVGAAFVAQYLALHFSEGVPFKWDVAAWQLVGWYVWLALTPAIVYLTRRYPIERARWRRRVALHLGVAVVMSVAEVALYTLLQGGVKRWVQEQPFDFVDAFRSALLRSLFFDVLFYACIGAVAHALSLERAYRARALHLARLETQLVEAQLRALRMQLNPHFLFNTLHTISAIMDENVRGARRLMADLSDLLRLSLDGLGRAFVPLAQEEDFLRRYLAIEAERLGDRLTVRFALSAEARAASVPHLILQPLVENAIRHAIAPFAAGGSVAVEGRVDGDVLTLRVLDDGPGLRPNAPTASTGIGLRTTRERLHHLYGESATLVVEARPEGGTAITLRLPYVTDVIESVSPDADALDPHALDPHALGPHGLGALGLDAPRPGLPAPHATRSAPHPTAP